VLRNLNFNPGDLLIVANTMLYATYTIFLRDRPKEASSLVVFAGMAGAALFTALPLLGYEVASGHVIWPTTARGWFAIFYIGLATSLVSQLMFIRAVELIGPSRSGLFVNLVPVFGALMAVGILGEPFGLYHAIALVLVVGGILLAELPVLRRILRRQPPLETAPRAAAPAEPRHG
jgi:drug/metabolite transporter (DMT)-like permease